MAAIVATDTDVTREISKVKILKNGCVEVEFVETKTIIIDGKPVEKGGNVKYEGTNLPHPDLVYAFSLLRSHLAILCAQLDGKKELLSKIDNDTEFLDLFKVNGISVGGTGEHQGVVLSGSKKIKWGILNLTSSFIKFEDTNNPYEYQDEFNHLVSHCRDEADLYIDGKIAPNAQQEFEFEGDDKSDLE